MGQQTKTSLFLSTTLEGLLKLFIVFSLFATTLSLHGQNIINPHHHLIEDLEHEYDELFNAGFETDISTNQLIDEGPFRNEINGTIWVRDSTHGYSLKKKENYRSLVLTRNKDGFPTQEISWYKKGFNKDGVWRKSSQKTTKYNKFNHPEEVLYQDWSSRNKEWVNNFKLTTKYNLDNQYTFFSWLDWDESNSTWINRRESVQEYNSHGQVVYKKTREWDKLLSKWDSYGISNYKYQNSLLIEVTTEAYDKKNYPDVKYYKHEYEYDLNNLIIGEKKYLKDSTLKWKLKNIRYKEYDQADSLVFEEYSYWNSSKQKFQVSSQTILNYDAKYNLVEYILRKFHRVSEMPFDLVHYISTYDENNYLIKQKSVYEWIDDTLERSLGINYYVNNNIGKPIYHISQTWNDLNKVWDNRFQWFYKYDNNDYKIEDLSTNWNSVDSIWEKSRLTTNQYDEYGHELDYAYFEGRGANWKEIRNTHSFWSEFELTTIEEGEIYLNIFPNPVTDQLIVEMDDKNELNSVILFDQLGNVLITNFEDRIIDMSALQAGTYFIYIHTTHGSVTRKIVKQ